MMDLAAIKARAEATVALWETYSDLARSVLVEDALFHARDVLALVRELERRPVVSDEMVLKAANAIANERGGRMGVPPITNVLDVLPAKLRAEVMKSAEVALTAALKG